jgi:Mu transposase, C-terminal domain
VSIVLAGEPVEAVAADHLVRIFDRDVLVAEHVQRRPPEKDPQPLRQGGRRARRPTDRMVVTRTVDSSGYVSFAGTNYRVGNAWRQRSVQVAIVADSVQLACDGQIVRIHPIRHDRAKEHGAFATPNGRLRHRQDEPAGAGVKATPLRDRPAGRALTSAPSGALSCATPAEVRVAYATDGRARRCWCRRPGSATSSWHGRTRRCGPSTPPLAAHRTVVRYDKPGCGPSDPGPGHQTLETDLEVLQAVADHAARSTSSLTHGPMPALGRLVGPGGGHGDQAGKACGPGPPASSG